jgi:hypothetical protein
MSFTDHSHEIPEDVAAPTSLMPEVLSDDPPLLRKPPGWRPDGIRWESPKTPTCSPAHLEDHALIAVLARGWVLPLELVQPLVFPDVPLKSVQQRARSFLRRGLVKVGHTTNDTGKPRIKLLAASRQAHALELAGGHHIPAAGEPFTGSVDPTGAHLVHHLQHATLVAALLLNHPGRIDDWRLTFPTLRNRRSRIGAVAELDVNTRRGDSVRASVVPITHPFHERRTLTKVRDHLAESDEQGRRPIVLVITPRLDEARRVLHYADTDLTIPGRDDQPARLRTLVMPLNRLDRQELVAYRLHPDGRDQRDPDRHPYAPVTLLPTQPAPAPTPRIPAPTELTQLSLLEAISY